MHTYPIRVLARPDQPGRWLWLVKWLLLIPHYIVLAVLWVAFVALTLVAYIAVLITGRYPAGIFDFNVGVLRWTWRVGYYGYSALGTDRYPPFTLADLPDYPARLQIDGPPSPPRWLPLVAWLFALPHLIIVGLMTGGGWSVDTADDRQVRYTAGLLGILVLVVGVVLLFTGRYPNGLFNLVVGIDRWVVRTVAYVALLTDRYPPLRLDQGGDEPIGGPSGPEPVTQFRAPSTPTPPAWAPPPAASPPAPSARTAGRVVTIVAGVLLLVAGIGSVLGGAAALAVHAARDSAGYIGSDPVSVSTATAAVTVEGFEIHPAHVFGRDLSGLDAIRIEVTNLGAAPLLVGIASEADVDSWLAGTAHDEVTGVYDDASGVRLDRSVGDVRPISTPAGQTFWLASATGTGPLRVEWVPGDGRFAVVLANADGSVGVTAEATVGAKVPVMRPLGTGLLAGGVVAGLLALLLIYLGAVGLGGYGGRGTPSVPLPSAPTAPAPPAGAGRPSEPATARPDQGKVLPGRR